LAEFGEHKRPAEENSQQEKSSRRGLGGRGNVKKKSEKRIFWQKKTLTAWEENKGLFPGNQSRPYHPGEKTVELVGEGRRGGGQKLLKKEKVVKKERNRLHKTLDAKGEGRGENWLNCHFSGGGPRKQRPRGTESVLKKKKSPPQRRQNQKTHGFKKEPRRGNTNVAAGQRLHQQTTAPAPEKGDGRNRVQKNRNCPQKERSYLSQKDAATKNLEPGGEKWVAQEKEKTKGKGGGLKRLCKNSSMQQRQDPWKVIFNIQREKDEKAEKKGPRMERGKKSRLLDEGRPPRINVKRTHTT